MIAEFDRTGGAPGDAFLDAALREEVAAGAIVPAYFGSAITGVGVRELLGGIEDWLPPAERAEEAPVVGTIFKIARRPSGEKIAYARLHAGRLAVRQRVALQRRAAFGEVERGEDRITGIDLFRAGATAQVAEVGAGEIVGLHGLRAARIGDRLGAATLTERDLAPAFPAPALESVVRPDDPGQISQLRAALGDLAEQDPLISLRQRNDAGEISVRLYGEVQKEVMQETLLRDYGLGVAFGPSRTICVERPLGTGEAAEVMGEGGNPFLATVGVRIEAAAPGSGLRYLRELGSLPLAFYRAIEETVHETLAQGLAGWAVTDCTVTLTRVGFDSVGSTAGDFRKLTPLVLLRALASAGTVVCEPIEELDLDIPEDTYGAVCGAVVNGRGTIRDTATEGASRRVVCTIPTAELRGIEQQLPRLTRGEGGWAVSFAGHVPVAGEPPRRERVGPNPLNRAHYLAEVARA